MKLLTKKAGIIFMIAALLAALLCWCGSGKQEQAAQGSGTQEQVAGGCLYCGSSFFFSYRNLNTAMPMIRT